MKVRSSNTSCAPTGWNIPALSGPFTYERAEETIRQRGAVDFPLPPKELLELMVRSVNANQKHLRQYVPGVFDGDMVIFSAARSGIANDAAPDAGFPAGRTPNSNRRPIPIAEMAPSRRRRAVGVFRRLHAS